MSRVDEALRRAASVPTLAARNGQIAERTGERLDRLGLEHYPEEQPGARDASPRRADLRAIPVVSPTRRPDLVALPHFSPAYRGKLVIDRDASPASIEQYRRLAASMHHLQAAQGLRRLMVSSAVPREGKTLTVVNLGMTLSESYGRRVLLVDGDLRRPSLHDVFGISNRFGLCNALESERSEIQFSRVSPNLWVLPAGSPDADPMAALASRQMEQLLDDLATDFDWILLDAPPLGLMADAGLLARLTRAVIVVIAAGSTPYTLVEKVIAELGREHIVGAVLNRVEENDAHWSTYYSDRTALGKLLKTDGGVNPEIAPR